MIRILLIISIVLSVCACKKKGKELIIKGGITNALTNVGISGAQVRLDGNGMNSGGFNPNFSQITSTVADGFGQYNIAFENPNPVQFKIKATANEYLDFEDTINPDQVLANQPFAYDIPLYPKGYIDIQLSNIAPGSSSDQLTFQLADYQLICPCCPTSQLAFSGPVIDYQQVCAVPAGRWHKYVYFHLKNGVSTTQLDSVWVEKGQTAVIQITF